MDTVRLQEICPTVSKQEGFRQDGPGMISYAGPGAAFFLSPKVLSLRIYSVDGRLIYSGYLEEGKNRIGLGTGVYLWRAGPYEGKLTIR